LLLRCLYCEISVPISIVADKRKGTFVLQDFLEGHPDLKKLGLFSTQEQALEAGFEPVDKRQRHHA